MKNYKKRTLSIVLSILLVLGMFSNFVMASGNDISGHWAVSEISDWHSKGLMTGYPDGSFRPDNDITRAEFISLVVNAFNYTQESEISFMDVGEEKWYYHSAKKAVHADLIAGYPDKTFRPDENITRQEAAVIVSKIKDLTPNLAKSNEFKDGYEIPVWSKGSVGAIVEAGYMGGYPDKTFKANNQITRAETVVALNNALKAETKNVIYDNAGTYGPAQGEKIIEGNVIVKADKVILQNLHIKGDLIIAEEVGTGDVTLNNIKVDGNTIIRGGGINSIRINGGQYSNIIIENTPSGGLRVVVKNAQGINVVIATSEPGDVVILEGIFSNVEVKASNAVVTTQGKTIIENIDVNSTANITVAAGTTVANITLNAAANVTGAGTVQTVNVYASNTKITLIKQPIIKLAEGVSAPTVGSTGGSSSGGSSSRTPVNAITVTGNAVVGATLTAASTPANATGIYQWSISDTVDGTYTIIAGATSNTYVPVTGDAGKYVKAAITGTGSYTGTQTSAAKGPIASPLEDITAASVTITAPVLGANPQEASAVEAATNHADYTVTGLVWNKAMTAGGKFKAAETYTATVTLTSKNSKKFQGTPFTPTAAGSASVGTTTTAGGDAAGNTCNRQVKMNKK